ncbi:MAG: hypothetical protein M3O70_05235 [Actinomycetota bacterium]|nr:hypothetical protein [Actinomycetota bacterium]
MRTEHLFRFVEIRSPLPGSAATVSAPPRNTFLTRVAAAVSTGVPLDDSRRREAETFFDSGDYLTRNSRWQPFLDAEPLVQRLLAEISPGEDLRSAIEQLLAEPLGGNSIEEFARSPEFAELADALWSSYFSGLVLLDRRPQDQPRLLFWIRFWRLLQRLANGEPHPAVITGFDTWRPVAPELLVRVEPEPPADPAATVRLTPPALEQRRQQIAAASAELGQLRAAHARIRELTLARLAASRPTAATPAPISSLRASTAGDLTVDPAELDPAVRDTLGRLGLDLATDDATEALAALEHHVAVAHSEVDRLRQVDQVVTVGGALVRRRRHLTDAELAEMEAR